ncbi:MAG: hypothetical protein HQL66_03110 [Magnetococcales bacterium]|nr:hypothetical protein [Magnetococcales bacterium]
MSDQAFDIDVSGVDVEGGSFLPTGQLSDRAAVFKRRIIIAHARSIDAILETCALLAAAMDELPTEEFHALVFTLPFTLPTARKMAQIGRAAWLRESGVVEKLPPAWGTIYQIIQMPEEEARRAIADGLIDKDVRRADVRALRGVAEHWANPQPTPEPTPEAADGLVEVVVEDSGEAAEKKGEPTLERGKSAPPQYVSSPYVEHILKLYAGESIVLRSALEHALEVREAHRDEIAPDNHFACSNVKRHCAILSDLLRRLG